MRTSLVPEKNLPLWVISAFLLAGFWVWSAAASTPDPRWAPIYHQRAAALQQQLAAYDPAVLCRASDGGDLVISPGESWYESDPEPRRRSAIVVRQLWEQAAGSGKAVLFYDPVTHSLTDD